ncbi:hypothetical protein WJX81_004418 [Elliptochloris bilobata]|uniref:Glycosyl hydrolase family 32 N-terminal domain-containing protein n=1 Tax=Elliptochloris bilobata TaxID=381761 RepID=A0AAW1RNE3_9CHLO
MFTIRHSPAFPGDGRGRGLQDNIPAAAPAPAGEPKPMAPSVGPEASGSTAPYGGAQPPVQGMTAGQHGEVLKPGFHITAPSGWMNDPNGLFQSQLGVFHIFYQWNPAAPLWSAPYWGHVASRDLVHWKRLPAAVMPDADYDADGAFSGSATVLADGTPVILYTGVSNVSRMGYYFQQQAMLMPTNASDPELQLWRKPHFNPIAVAPPVSGGNFAQFRDPSTCWREDGLWYTVIGVQDNCIGGAAMYSSPDMHAWTYVGQLASQLGINATAGLQCTAPPVAQPGNGACDQMGADCHTWECPDYFGMDYGVSVLKWSDQVRGRTPFAADWYMLSSADARANASNVAAGGAIGAFNASTAYYGLALSPQLIDFGSVYASKSFRTNDNRTIWMGWVFETSTGCSEQCSAGSPLTQAWGWQGVQTLPRVVTLDYDTPAMIMAPVAEIESLRMAQLFDAQGIALSGRDNTRVLTGGGAESRIGLSGTLRPAARGRYMVVTQATLYANHSNAGGATAVLDQRGNIPLPASGISVDGLSMRVFVDRSLIEVFALNGRGRMATPLLTQW